MKWYNSSLEFELDYVKLWQGCSVSYIYFQSLIIDCQGYELSLLSFSVAPVVCLLLCVRQGFSL